MASFDSGERFYAQSTAGLHGPSIDSSPSTELHRGLPDFSGAEMDDSDFEKVKANIRLAGSSILKGVGVGEHARLRTKCPPFQLTAI